MNTEHANKLIENWNGKDRIFTMEGEIYHEDDVNEAFEYLETNKNQ